jgi:hypothetical protein
VVLRREIGRHIFAEPRHGLHQALSGTVFPDDAIAFGRRREVAAPGHAGAAAEILEDDGLPELHRLDILAAAVTVDDALRRHDLVEGDAVLIIAAVGAMHHEAPDPARPQIEARGCGGEAVRSPPLRQMFGIGPGREHQIARSIEFAHADNRARIGVEIEATSYGHVYSPFYRP